MEVDLNKINKVFLIGIGGISMSGLGLILKSEGKTVSGSDIVKSNITKKLKRQGIKVYYKHNAKNVKNTDLVVFSGAISETNSEYNYAKINNIPIIERSQLLYLISKSYKNVIAVSGTHGKTTTAAMLSYAFIVAGLNPTVHIGGEFDYINGNVLIGGKNYFITEACEFRDSFLTLKPTTSIITNIEPEHLDYFKTFENEKTSFNKFKSLTTNNCYCGSSAKNYILEKKNLVTYGINKTNNIYSQNEKLNSDGKYSFDFFKNKTYIGNFKLNVYGKHNIKNALGVIGVCLDYGIPYRAIYLALKTFNNAHRRFEILGRYKQCYVIHDYAHHPTEILTTIKTCKEVFNKRVICVFQPHTYSRTKTLIESFSKCFNGLDSLYLLKTYSARESYDYLGSAEYLKQSLQNKNPNFLVKGTYTKKQFLKQIKIQKLENCVLLFLGAGNIETIARKLAK